MIFLIFSISVKKSEKSKKIMVQTFFFTILILKIMYKIFFTIALCVFILTDTQAQTATRYDTVMVAVFNTGAKYRVAPAEFGASTSTLFDAKRQFVGTLVAGNDTVHTWGTKNCDTCKIQKKQTTLRCRTAAIIFLAI